MHSVVATDAFVDILDCQLILNAREMTVTKKLLRNSPSLLPLEATGDVILGKDEASVPFPVPDAFTASKRFETNQDTQWDKKR
jgi:hypothetical protein